jgi:hypothetical protein
VLNLPLRITDPALPTDASGALPIDLGVTASGASTMRFWFGDGDAPPDAAWQPIANPLRVTLPDLGVRVVSVQVRDAAGNASPILRVAVTDQAGCVVADAGPGQILECAGGGATATRTASSARTGTISCSGMTGTISWTAARATTC